MDIYITLENKPWAIAALIALFLVSALAVVAFNTGNPSFVGHSSNEFRFNTTFFNATQRCGMSSFQNISNSNGTTFCSITSRTDRVNTLVASFECEVRRRTDGVWEYQVLGACGSVDCGISCFKIN